MASPRPLNPTMAQPWRSKELSYGVKLALMFVCALLLIILIVGLFVVIGVSGELMRGRTAPENVRSNLIAIGIAFAMLIGGLCGLLLLWPYTRATTRFTPSYGALPPTTTAAPFGVKFKRYLWGRSMRGGGTVRFDADALTIEGHVEPHALFQIGIVLLLTFLPLFLFGIGLGIIPALIIAYYVGRKQISRPIAYGELRDLRVEGSQVTFRTAASPKQVSFAVAAIDGERLYRELLPRFPAALGGWVG